MAAWRKSLQEDMTKHKPLREVDLAQTDLMEQQRKVQAARSQTRRAGCGARSVRSREGRREPGWMAWGGAELGVVTVWRERDRRDGYAGREEGRGRG